ncbi:unnamed protein product [Sphagnum jensenii]|uniref:Uncharacterized protein n=1 Tax=Sphagnum jensenii TaxID=128206 RepID=A0ABP1BZA7_9BRYO
MQKEFNQLKQEHGESSAAQCKWPWFEQCLMIWGNTARACGTAGSMGNGAPTYSVGGSAREPVNWEDIEEHDAPPSPDRQAPPFASNSSQVSKTPPTPRSAACKKPGVDANFKEQAGRSQGFHDHVRDPKEAQGAVYSAP